MALHVQVDCIFHKQHTIAIEIGRKSKREEEFVVLKATGLHAIAITKIIKTICLTSTFQHSHLYLVNRRKIRPVLL